MFLTLIPVSSITMFQRSSAFPTESVFCIPSPQMICCESSIYLHLRSFGEFITDFSNGILSQTNQTLSALLYSLLLITIPVSTSIIPIKTHIVIFSWNHKIPIRVATTGSIEAIIEARPFSTPFRPMV